jgi:hypothetical protein
MNPYTLFFGCWFVSGFSLAGEHKVRPYIGFAHRLGFGLTCNFCTGRSEYNILTAFFNNLTFSLIP